MASEPLLPVFELPIAQRHRIWDSKIWFEYLALTKPEVNFLIVVTTFAGFYLGWPWAWREFPFLRSLNTVLGTLLVASGTGALNQYSERCFDAQMRRTSRRPLAAGRLNASAVLWFGIGLSFVGTVYLAAAVNLLASLLALGTLLAYLFFYTPLKRKSPVCTLIGAFAGAAPPLIGWAAASGQLNFGAWILYSVLFLWQLPHFMSIAWMYREDYVRAGYLVLPIDHGPRLRFVNWQTLLPLLILLPVSLFPVLSSQWSLGYWIGAVLLWAGFSYFAARFVHRKSNSSARQLLAASILYLPGLFGLMILVRG